MPIYDLTCQNGHERRDVFCTYAESQAPCPVCQGDVSQIVSAKAVHTEPVGGFWQTNGFREPRWFPNQAALRQALDAKGLQVKDFAHVPVPGSDKSPISSNWASVSRGTLEQAAALVARVGSAAAGPPTRTVLTARGLREETVVSEAPVAITVTDAGTFTYRSER